MQYTWVTHEVETRRRTAAEVVADEIILLWVDPGTMRFYPDVWEFAGWETRIPNLLMMLTLARSWAARADATGDLDAAFGDYRRAVRLERLLRQEDALAITDVVHFEGNAAQRRQTAELLERLAASDDPWVARVADWARRTPPDSELFRDLH